MFAIICGILSALNLYFWYDSGSTLNGVFGVILGVVFVVLLFESAGRRY